MVVMIMCVFVRELTAQEGNKLTRIARRGSNSVEVRRALVILASAQKMRVPEIPGLYPLSKERVRHIIRTSNEDAVPSLKPRYGGGRPRTFTQEQRADMVELAQIPPKTLGLPLAPWSL